MTSPESPQVLIVEDDENLGLALADNLEDEGYAVTRCITGHAALEHLKSHEADLILLDLMLPDTDGYTVCRKLRERGCAAMILMLTARTLEEDIVRGFEAGADDYVTKPYRLAVLLARVQALLRRRGPVTNELTFGHWSIDLAGRELRGQDGSSPALTRTEFDLLAYLLQHRGRALTRQELLDQVWGADVVVDMRTVDNFVSSVKKKLGWAEGAGYTIRTIRGVGYRMELE